MKRLPVPDCEERCLLGQTRIQQRSGYGGRPCRTSQAERETIKLIGFDTWKGTRSTSPLTFRRFFLFGENEMMCTEVVWAHGAVCSGICCLRVGLLQVYYKIRRVERFFNFWGVCFGVFWGF